MTTDIFHKREQALENDFFRQVDNELLRQMKKNTESVRNRNELAVATGITDDHVLDELIDLGINSDTVLALWVFPLVWVAWSDGQIDQQQRQEILNSASDLGHHEATASYKLIESWLDFKPGADLKKAWKDYMGFICESLSKEARLAIQRDSIKRVRKLAEAATYRYGFDIVERAQESAIRELEQCFVCVDFDAELD